MGASIDFMIEYDDSDDMPFELDIDGVIDFTKSLNITQCKPYALMQAIVGIRGNKEIIPKIPPRGFPENMNWMVKEYYDRSYGMDYEFAGWLYLSELEECLSHASMNKTDLDDAIQHMIQIMQTIVDRIGDKRARLVFAIST